MILLLTYPYTRIEPAIGSKYYVRMTISQRRWILGGLLLAGMLIPVWIGRYAPLYDYPAHLLEAQVATHATDPHSSYADGYDINSGWYLRSNALSTLVMVGLGRVMPVTVAGHFALSLYLALLVGGLGLLLRQTGAQWPLLLLAPTVAYNIAFTSGWINYGYSVALGLYALVIYRRWQAQGRSRDLVWLALVLLLIYVAHMMAWALMLVALAAMSAVQVVRLRRHGALLLAMNSALPLLLVTRPALGAIAALIGPGIWCGAALLRRLRLTKRVTLVGAAAAAAVALGLSKILESLVRQWSPALDYSQFDKITWPVRLFTLPHQFLPPDPLLIAYNLALVMLVVALTGLLIWSALSQPGPDKSGDLAACGLLGLLYVVIPTRTTDIWVTEPRVLLTITGIALGMVRLPRAGSLAWRGVTVCAVSLCLLSLGGTVRYAQAFDRQARAWRDQMSALAPARSVLVMREQTSPYISRPTVLGIFNRFYTGEYFAATYALENGGFVSRVFNNGPVRPGATTPIPAYDWPGFDDAQYIAQQCPALRSAYDAVLFWGAPDAAIEAQLDSCFAAGPRWRDMAVWRR